MQQAADTFKSPPPASAARIPVIRAARADTGLLVASRMDGNVITASVTYGT